MITTAWALACQGHWDGPALALLLKRLYLRVHLSLTPIDVMRFMALNLAVRTVSPVPNLCIGERFHLLESALHRREVEAAAAAAAAPARRCSSVGANLKEDGGRGAGMASAPRGGTVEVIDPGGEGAARDLLTAAHDFVTHELLLFDWAVPAARVAL